MIKTISGIAIAAMLLGSGLPVFAVDGIGAVPVSEGINYTHMPGPDMADDGIAAPAGVISNHYLFLVGSAFTPRSSSQTVTYAGGGCSNSSAALTTSLELPQGASILGVRLFFNNNGTPNAVGMFLSTYPGNGDVTDELTGTSSASAGYTSVYFSPPAPLIVDNLSQAYVLTATTLGSSRVCGMRVFYAL